jgi:hypothetical protein
VSTNRHSQRFIQLVQSCFVGGFKLELGGRLAGEETRSASSPRRRFRSVCLISVLAVCGSLLVASSALAAANFTWSGAAPVGEATWSKTTNWEGGTAPSGSVGTLTFPALTGGACTAKPPTATCYESNHDLSGLSIEGISIDDSRPYRITGNPITLGSEGLKASTTNNSFLQPPTISNPIVLGAEQKWSVDGNHVYAQLELEGNVTGEAHALGISLTHGTFLGLYGDVEVGPVAVTGDGGGGGGNASGAIALGYPGNVAKLNASDKNLTSFKEGAGLFADKGSTGPLSFSGGMLQVGDSINGGTLAVAGGVTLDSSSELTASITKPGMIAGTDYSQLSASETVKLGGASLFLDGEEFPEGGGTAHCPTLKVGNVDTLITTSGSLTGTFNKVPGGAVVRVFCSPGTQPTVEIKYTEHTVTATVLTPGAGGKPTTTKLAASPESSVTNQSVMLTATVSAESGTPSGTVSFRNHGVAIPGCEPGIVAGEPLHRDLPHHVRCRLLA